MFSSFVFGVIWCFGVLLGIVSCYLGVWGSFGSFSWCGLGFVKCILVYAVVFFWFCWLLQVLYWLVGCAVYYWVSLGIALVLFGYCFGVICCFRLFITWFLVLGAVCLFFCCLPGGDLGCFLCYLLLGFVVVLCSFMLGVNCLFVNWVLVGCWLDVG